ncbi:MAG: hypothetical protein ACRYFX_18865 [Janthinobacterium lividum]
METQYSATQVRYNNLSDRAKALIKEWEAQKGIKEDEPLLFEMIGNGDTALVAQKGTHDGDMAEAYRTKPLSPQGTVNGESIVDPGTGEAVHLLYFTGMYSPNVPKKVIMFMPIDIAPDGSKGQTVLRVPPFTKKSNPDLYRYLIMSNYMEDNANPAQVPPANGFLYRLVRPTEVVAQGWEQRMGLNAAMQEISVATRSTLLSLAPKLNIAHPVGVTDDQLRENFAKYAEKGQNYLTLTQLFNADETKFTLNVDKAVERSIVAVDADKAVWVFTDTQAVICPAKPTDSTTKQLVNFLLVEDGQTTYKQILALLAKKK